MVGVVIECDNVVIKLDVPAVGHDQRNADVANDRVIFENHFRR